MNERKASHSKPFFSAHLGDISTITKPGGTQFLWNLAYAMKQVLSFKKTMSIERVTVRRKRSIRHEFEKKMHITKDA